MEELELKALSVIQLCLAPHALREVLDKTTALGLLVQLEELYITKSLANKIRLKGKVIPFQSGRRYSYSKTSKLGHIVTNCWKLENNKEKEEKNQSKKPATADCIIESESDGDVLVATTYGKGVDGDWVLDSDCTYHMCFHRDWFATWKGLFIFAF